MPKKKTVSVLYIQDPKSPLPIMVAMNRAARKAYPKNPAQRIWPIRKDARGNYYREDPKEKERVRAAERKRRESLRRELAAAKALSRAQKANQRDAKKPRTGEDEVRTPPPENRDEGDFRCADADG